jgi:hypothetical protein
VRLWIFMTDEIMYLLLLYTAVFAVAIL